MPPQKRPAAAAAAVVPPQSLSAYVLEKNLEPLDGAPSADPQEGEDVFAVVERYGNSDSSAPAGEVLAIFRDRDEAEAYRTVVVRRFWASYQVSHGKLHEGKLQEPTLSRGNWVFTNPLNDTFEWVITTKKLR
mmetsp:Transcript_34853/g.52471  ORF Transcript_34853/g.52471 Transcript_34853/m.52471 type:complete len:133 (-) Transcript_34853:37-435(-)|eukprot:CAMPEP_0195027840 /NCGR_PEP_ID=MMETSP0326_2-20130528/53128_1 /TAXON_ID=2866 ORGANISM="Crypthecodinium cohnii, Strain Seligo" /NCGR_SAMPLE_ID=MMETSP0326_2 /ASSEMBLY_ACC=CAM_ASM_000348 /LENGTH=132 /DNA_ID=CAMNT_0040050157 /DNA_START=21 /DNA_END=419 /DNA_ORIENTATION=+